MGVVWTADDGVFRVKAWNTQTLSPTPGVKVSDYNSTRTTLIVGWRADANSHFQEWYLGGPPGIGIPFAIPPVATNPAAYNPESHVYKRVNFGGEIEGEIWYKTDYLNPDGMVVLDVGCSCDIGESFCCDEMGIQQYERSFSTVLAPNIATGSVQLFRGNPNRVMLVVACRDNQVGSILYIGTDSAFNHALSITTNPDTITMPYRDWGPLITGDIWVARSNVANPVTVNGSEVFKVPQ